MNAACRYAPMLASQPVRKSLAGLMMTSAALLMAACQPGASGHNPWFPLVAGTEQVYNVTTVGDEPQVDERWTLRVRGPETVGEQQTMVRYHSEGIAYYLVTDDTGIRRIATKTDVDADPTPDAEDRWVLRAPYQVGTEWSSPTVPYLLQHRNEYPRQLKYTHRAVMAWRIEALDDTVITAAGQTFKPCLRVVGTAKLNLYTDPVNGFTDVPLISREWYCQGRGLVKFEREEKVPAGFLTGGVLSAELAP
jgi:hypothetical protein